MVRLHLQARDVIVTRGGTTTCTEALHLRCPVIFNAFGGIMPQEQLTWKFFRNGASSRKIERADEFAAIIGEWLDNPDSYAQARANFVGLRYEEDPTILIDDLVSLANEVARTKLRRRSFPPKGNGAPKVNGMPGPK